MLKNILNLISLITQEVESNLRENKSEVLNTKLSNSLGKNPWRKLPNTKDFFVSINQLDPLLSMYGVSKKFTPELKNLPLNNRIRAANRYLDIQYAVLCKLLIKGKAKQFWLRCMMLLHKSYVLRLVALRKLNKNWARDLSFGLIKNLLQDLDSKIFNLSKRLYLVRSYVDKVKPDGTKTYRPIGAPSYADRMLLYLLSCFFVIFLSQYIGPYQHAYRPGRGVVTAWQDLQRLHEYDNIYEFDLKQFFPSVNISAVTNLLKELGTPEGICNWMFDLSLSYPDPETVDPSKGVDEINALTKAELDDVGLLYGEGEFKSSWKRRWTNPDGSYKGVVLGPIFEFIKANGEDLLIELMSEDLGYSRNEIKSNWYACLYEYYQVQAALFESFKPQGEVFRESVETSPGFHDGQVNDREPHSRNPGYALTDLEVHKGFPQGGSLSPIFSILAFEYALYREHFLNVLNNWNSGYGVKTKASGRPYLENFKIVAYADDFIILTKFPITVEELFKETPIMKAFGIKFNPEKSGWIRKGGKWVVNKFKFLGITYNPKSNLITGTPRSGKDLMFDKGAMLDDFISRDQILTHISDVCRWGKTPQQILDLWGTAVHPYSCIPESVIRDGKPISPETLQGLLEETYDMDPASTLTTESGSEVDQDRLGSFKSNKKFGRGWLSSPRLAGLLMNRLHSGSWKALHEVLPEINDEYNLGKIWFEQDEPQGGNKVHPKSLASRLVKGDNRFTAVLTNLNCSSYGTLLLLKHYNKSSKGPRIKGGALKIPQTSKDLI